MLAGIGYAVAYTGSASITPGRLGAHLMSADFHPASLVSAAVRLAVVAIIIASIWP